MNNNTILTDEKINKTLEILEKNNLSEFDNFIKENNIELKEFKTKNFDIIVYAIENDISESIIEYIIIHGKYETLNFDIIENNQFKVPLFEALKKSNFNTADILIKNNADINYLDCNILYQLYQQNFLNNKNLKYILHNGLSIKAINPNFIYNLISDSQNTILEIIFKHYKYNNLFILDLLDLYKKYNIRTDQKKPSNENLLILNDYFKSIFIREKNKISIEDVMYEKAIESTNYDILRILYENENNNEDEILNRIYTYDLMEKSIKANSFSFIKKILKYDPFNYKCINYRNILIDAVRNCDEKIVKLLIQSFICTSPNKPRSKFNKTSNQNYDIQYLNLLLNIFIKMNNDKYIKYIVENNNFNIDINKMDINGEYPIITAFNNNNIEILKYLLEHGGDCNTKNNNGLSLLMLAIDKSNYNMVKYLLQNPNINIYENDINGNSPLIKAIGQNNIDLVKLLIDYCIRNKIKIDINGKDSNGNYPLIKAINQNNFDIVFLLVNYGIKNNIDMNIININGNTPLTLSYKQGHLKIFKYLIKFININQKDTCGNTIIYYVIDNQDIEMVKNLISIGADINLKNVFNNSVLDHAISQGNIEMVKVLLENDNILLNEVNSQGETPLISIIKTIDYEMEEKEEIINALIKKGSKVNVIDKYGNSPLIYALRNNYSSISKQLIKAGAFINIKNNEGLSPLDYSIKSKNYEITSFIFDNSIDIYNSNNICFESFSQIIMDNKLNLFKKLVDDNFDINRIGNDGNTLLHYAISCGHLDMVKYLLRCGADKSIINYKGQNAATINMDCNRFNQTYRYIERLLIN